MNVATLSRLGTTGALKGFVDTCRTAKSVVACRRRRYDISPEPYFDDPGTAYFREQLEHTGNYLEYGSGGSTLFASRRVKLLVSVESDAHYLAAVRRKLAAEGTPRERRKSGGAVTKLIYANIGFTVEWGKPAFARPTPRRVHRWADYPTAPWRYFRSIGQQPQLILVDGRFRVACVIESLIQLSPSSEATILIDDYITRPHYHVVERLADVEMVGRMAVLHPRPSWDRSEGRQLLVQYRTDPR
jgi:hypothetical protein